ncbi:MAG: hypothetical protein G01um10145_381 [Microgenomates group bacterium Gr01-1014_5]|nr:MAG: hypothetical protein G01um10145_381 [Microgenomates group bacterium Gr01-1014_5]
MDGSAEDSSRIKSNTEARDACTSYKIFHFLIFHLSLIFKLINFSIFKLNNRCLNVKLDNLARSASVVGERSVRFEGES